MGNTYGDGNRYSCLNSHGDWIFAGCVIKLVKITVGVDIITKLMISILNCLIYY